MGQLPSGRTGDEKSRQRSGGAGSAASNRIDAGYRAPGARAARGGSCLIAQGGWNWRRTARTGSASPPPAGTFSREALSEIAEARIAGWRNSTNSRNVLNEILRIAAFRIPADHRPARKPASPCQTSRFWPADWKTEAVRG